MFVGIINSPCEYGKKVIVEAKTKIGARRVLKQSGKGIEQLRRITPSQADLMLLRRQATEIYG